ncbi:hypothetical protein KFE98_00500 [bacterium SCSIO 12741]|nr:hypothetical protein KFE98_00500 [bacterium SCSIO 12741]
MKEVIIASCMLLTLVVFKFLNKKAASPVVMRNTHSMPKAYLFMGYLMILIALAILIVPRFMSNAPEYYHPLVWLIIVAVFLFGVWIIRLCQVHKVSTTDDGFTVHTLFGQEKEFKFDQIQSLNISLLTYFISIKDKQGQKSNMYFHLTGLIVVLKKIRSKSGKDITAIERLLSSF